jgi:prophage regulatory protein
MKNDDASLLMGEVHEPHTFLRIQEVCNFTGLTRSGIYYLIREGTFPKAVPLGAKSVAWIQSEIKHWQEKCIAQRSPAR